MSTAKMATHVYIGLGWLSSIDGKNDVKREPEELAEAILSFRARLLSTFTCSQWNKLCFMNGLFSSRNH